VLDYGNLISIWVTSSISGKRFKVVGGRHGATEALQLL
jgi:hypothetical protein